MEFEALGCPATGGNRTLSLTFICDPHAGTAPLPVYPDHTTLATQYIVRRWYSSVHVRNAAHTYCSVPSMLQPLLLAGHFPAYGEPETWTEGGKAAALNPALGYPAWVNRTGPYLPVEGPSGKCSHSMVW